jgi:RNA polymerase sigma factor (TIGR02999 family)
MRKPPLVVCPEGHRLTCDKMTASQASQASMTKPEPGRPSSSESISELLAGWARHDSSSRERLMPLVYDELRRLAAHYMRGERAAATLQPTALVNEMYLRIAGLDRLQFRDRAHFMAMAATIMRRVLIDHARDRARDKRGGGVTVTSLTDQEAFAQERGIDLIALDEALGRLGALDPTQFRVVELRYFGGLTIDETAEALSISPATVKREWALARAWLYEQLSP